MRTAILETFPEPNRRLLQRILLMMQHVAAHKTENRMSVSGVAACMSPLLLRPLLAGDCELENTHMEVAGDGSLQLLQAAAAANHAQAIVITLLEEYDNIFGEGSVSPELFSDSDESYTGTEDGTDDDETYDDDDDDDDDEDDHEDASGTDGDYEHSGSETCSDGSDHGGSDSYDDKKSSSSSSSSKSPKKVHHHRAKKRSPSVLPRKHDSMLRTTSSKKRNNAKSVAAADGTKKSHRSDVPSDKSSVNELGSSSPIPGSQVASAKLPESSSQGGRPMWGRAPARKNVSMESVDYSPDEEEEIRRLANTKSELESQIAEKANHNAVLKANMEKRKKDLHEHRLALEKDVARLQDQLQKEKDIGAALECGDISRLPAGIDVKTKAQLKEIALAEEKNNNMKQRVDDLGAQINQQREKNTALIQERSTRKQETSSLGTMSQNNKDNASNDTSHHIERSSKNEGQRSNNRDGTNRDKDGKSESSPSTKNQHQQIDASRGGTSTVGTLPSNSSPTESFKSLSSSSKKSGKVEGGNSTTLSKLTNRLNFLKERRNQIANELENLDKGKGSSNQFMQNSGKGKGQEETNQGREGSSVQTREDISRQLTSHTTLRGSPSGTDNKDGSKKGSSSKSDMSAIQNSDRGRKSENQSSQHFDRSKSEGQSSAKSAEKGRQQDGKHSEQPKKQDGKHFNSSSSKVTR